MIFLINKSKRTIARRRYYMRYWFIGFLGNLRISPRRRLLCSPQDFFIRSLKSSGLYLAESIAGPRDQNLLGTSQRVASNFYWRDCL
jgi:hypothetical protein